MICRNNDTLPCYECFPLQVNVRWGQLTEMEHTQLSQLAYQNMGIGRSLSGCNPRVLLAAVHACKPAWHREHITGFTAMLGHGFLLPTCHLAVCAGGKAAWPLKTKAAVLLAAVVRQQGPPVYAQLVPQLIQQASEGPAQVGRLRSATSWRQLCRCACGTEQHCMQERIHSCTHLARKSQPLASLCTADTEYSDFLRTMPVCWSHGVAMEINTLAAHVVP
jgi:hypothetical protein